MLPKHQRRFGFEPPTEDKVIDVRKRLESLRVKRSAGAQAQPCDGRGGGGDDGGGGGDEGGGEVGGVGGGGAAHGARDALETKIADELFSVVEDCMCALSSPSQQTTCLQLAFDAIVEADGIGQDGLLGLYLFEQCKSALSKR